MATPPFDLILFGATSFVGKILARELDKLSSGPAPFRWAIAARSQEKLEALKATLSHSDTKIVIADSFDQESLFAMCRQTRVIVSTVGPFARYGENLLQACVDTGTDYCDICGESQWILQMLSKYQSQAEATGARIVPSCAFDSIPSDLGVYYTQKQATQLFGQCCEHIRMRVKTMKGKFSGGTYASLMNLVEELAENQALKKALANPYCFCPSDHPYTQKQKRLSMAEFDESSDSWIAPFVMEGINCRTVHRSNALLNHHYGTHFLYDEAILTGSGRKGRKLASRISYGLGLLFFATSVGFLRAVLQRWILPKPGEGPSEHEQETGHYELLFCAKARGKGELSVSLTGDKDPGYGSSAKILAQAALCLAEDTPKEEAPGGFWTPASLFQDKLITRLETHAGLHFSVTDSTKH